MNKKDCKYKQCINVEVDWLNILLSVSASHTITELFKVSECTVDPNSLRSGGKFRKFADWEHVKQTCDSIGAKQLLELKRVTSDFQKDRIASYKNLLRFQSNDGTITQRSIRDADKVAYQYADATHTTFRSQSPQWTMMASNAISLSMTSKPTPASRTPTVSSSSP